MTLVLRPMKNGVRFEHADEDTETSVYIDKADTDEDMVRKLRRVIALVEGMAPKAPPMRVGVDPEETAVAVQSTNGWAAVYGPPALPDRLQGEVELVQPGEDA